MPHVPENPKEIDLDPQDWTSEREKPKEPFFGEGLVPWLIYMVGFAITYFAVHTFRG
jgi:hypothetical protein